MSKKKVLVIDDEKLFTELIKSNLEMTGKYEVETENKGANAKFTARDFRPDIILVDVIMPGVSGVSVVEELSNDEELKNIPVIFLTALSTTEKTVNQDIMINDHPFISKPVSVKELVSSIEKYARK